MNERTHERIKNCKDYDDRGVWVVQTGKIAPIPIVLVGRDFWQRALDARFLADEGVIAPDDLELFTYAEEAEEIWGIIKQHGRETTR